MIELQNTKIDTPISNEKRNKKLKMSKSKCKEYFSIRLNNISPKVFYVSQWPMGELPFLVYKGIVTIYTIIILIWSVKGFEFALSPKRSWPVWLTNWSYLLLTAYFLCSFITVLYNYIKKYKCSKVTIMNNPPMHLKITWSFYILALPLSYLVTLVFFVALFPKKNLDFIPSGDIHTHLMNSVLATLEILIGAMPIRIFHIFYPIMFGFAYSVFSLVYWVLDPEGNVIYPGILDWNQPGRTLMVIINLTFIMAPVIHLAQYLLFRMRLKIHSFLFCNNFGED